MHGCTVLEPIYIARLLIDLLTGKETETYQAITYIETSGKIPNVSKQ